MPSQPASNSSNNDDNKEKDAMLRQVMQDMNSNNDYDNTLDAEVGMVEWWESFREHNARILSHRRLSPTASPLILNGASLTSRQRSMAFD